MECSFIAKASEHLTAHSWIHIYLMDVTMFKHLIKHIRKSWLYAIVGMDYFYSQHGERRISEQGNFRSRGISFCKNIAVITKASQELS